MLGQTSINPVDSPIYKFSLWMSNGKGIVFCKRWVEVHIADNKYLRVNDKNAASSKGAVREL